ncbi:hypothetical protein NCG89_07280 [Spongiibacter taiwanensis]|uniref:hypothetical protein n=1 Tax=Spongiibacter taiwanensis TaxID=1748242 RepID=UPI0020350E3A|nr:hypothetical protein [Spongiibacter taiwanensis]USA44570.1 hypothetical protein NCG89_07280 [Spongiibacter taiwanensis]
MATKLAKSLRKRINLLTFFAHRRLYGFDVPEQPHFDPDSTAYFVAALDRCQRYLEYGSGGSTVLAAEKGKPMTSVDSDPIFLDSVVSKIRDRGCLSPDTQQFLHADIGLTKEWGKPLFTQHSRKRLNRWRAYSEAPWRQTTAHNPDLVLVDGRFRVASALCAIKHLSGHRKSWELLVDDYEYHGKYRYQAIEKFARLSGMVGRMAVFVERPDIDRAALESAINHFQRDPT